MTKDELLKWHQEELNDSERYLKGASEMENDHPHEAGILRDIAHEEQTHAKHLAYIIEEM